MWQLIVAGALGGVLRAILGYLQNASEESFEWTKAIRSILIALILGAVFGLTTTLDTVGTFLAAFTGTVAIESLGIAAIKASEPTKKK
jgi:hypothetical protein